MLFVDIDDNGRFLMSKKAVQYIQSIETNIAVLSVVGPYRTGKSFLLNRFAGCQRGFKLGPSTNPCTKGIWIWGETIADDNLTILLLDTEGLNSYERDQNLDARLLVLSCILSSTVLYNVMTVIDERSLESLSFTTNISKHLLGTEQFITQYLPNIVWVVRDFSLDLDGKTADYYMENSLKMLEGDTEEIEQKNNIRIAISKYFKRRSCFTLIRPVNDERQLRDIDKLGYNDLRMEFRNQVEQMIGGVLRDLRPKVFKGVPLNGVRLIELVTYFVQAINSNAIPNIENSWDRIVDKEYIRLLQTVKSIINSDVDLPMSNEQLINGLNSLHTKSLELIMNFNICPEKQLEAVEWLRVQQLERFDHLMAENQLKSKKINQVITKKMYEVINQAQEGSKLQNIPQLIQQLGNLKKIYIQEAKEPTQYQVYVQFLEMVLQIIERVHNNNIISYQMKEDILQQEIVVLQGQNKTLKQLLTQEKENLNKQLDDVKVTLQQERIVYEGKLLDLKERLEGEGIRIKEGELFDDPDNYIKKEHKLQMKQNNELQIEMLKELNERMEQLAEHQEKILQARVDIEYEKVYHKAQMEQQDKLNIQLERMKLTYEGENKVLKEDRMRLENLRESLQVGLVEKECEVKMLKEKIKQIERQKTKDIEHADVMCKISDQLIKVLRRLDKKS